MSKKRFSSMSNLDVVRSYLDGKRPYLTISYNQTEKDKHRTEGEKWEIGGIKWERKGGKNIKVTKTQGDIIREAIGDSLNCKNCRLQYKWGSKNDLKFLRRTGLCEDCLIEFETKLRVLGMYNNYEKYHMASHELGYLKESREKIKETIEYFNRTDGNIVKFAETEYDENIVWENTNKDKIVADATADLKRVEDLILVGTKITAKLKKQYLGGIKKNKIKSYV